MPSAVNPSRKRSTANYANGREKGRRICRASAPLAQTGGNRGGRPTNRLSWRRLQLYEDEVHGRRADIFRGVGQRLAVEHVAGL